MNPRSSTSSSEPRRPTAYGTLLDALAAAPAERPFATMWSDDEEEAVSFGAFRHQAEGWRRFLGARGVGVGDRVVLVLPQGIPLMAACAGAMRAGAVPSILAYPSFKMEPAKYRAGLAGVSANLQARLIVIDEAFPAELRACIDDSAVSGAVVSVGGAPAPVAPGDPPAAVRPDQIAFIQHSAGTTGLQKGVAVTHAAVLRQIEHLATALRLGDQDRIYSWLPLYHDMGMVACFVLPLVCHLPLVMQSPTEWVLRPQTMLELIARHRCTLAWVPNFALQFLARRVRRAEPAACDLSSLRALINCSEPVRAGSLAEFAAAFAPFGLDPRALQSSYALAENVFAVTQSGRAGQAGPSQLWVDAARLRDEHQAVPRPAGEDGAVALVSSGPLLEGNAVRIVAGDGQPLAEGAVGEIVIRSDSLFEGYFNQPARTAEVLRDGWYWTGDLGLLWRDELYVIGRKRDLIIVAGKNIYPQDVEEIAFGHPAIHDGRAVALGLFNAELGTEDVVVVAERESAGDWSEADVEREVRQTVTRELGITLRALYLKPPGWLVKSTAGKPARSATRDKLLAQHPELSDASVTEGARR